ncbi:hypothetical protein GCM10017600_85560 [Streptosporangium carneum]|uniref:Secreted protein n=1 Tax=Streptosporangium carneum TaxID=47481 RepID=A0A9W6ICF6_9ACTN|nr:hypothetical protein GCM10017600_85560 [Streptosporangium carneum]
MWCGATVLAASITWFGVRDVLRSQVFDDARVESLNSALTRVGAAPLVPTTPTGPGETPGTPSASPSRSRHVPAPDVSVTATRDTRQTRTTGSPHTTIRDPARSKGSTISNPVRSTTAAPPPAQTTSAAPKAARPSATPSSSAQAALADEGTRVVSARNGSVSFSIEAGVCRLVAASPNAGFESQVSQADGWIRVDLVQGQHGSAVFCIGKENRTDVWEY